MLLFQHSMDLSLLCIHRTDDSDDDDGSLFQARLWCVTYMKSLDCMTCKVGTIFIPFFRWRNWGTENLSNLFKFTQLVSDRAGIWILSIWFPWPSHNFMALMSLQVLVPVHTLTLSSRTTLYPDYFQSLTLLTVYIVSPNHSCICQPQFHCSSSSTRITLFPIPSPLWSPLSTSCASCNASLICYLFWEAFLGSSSFNTPQIPCLYFPLGTHGLLICICVYLSPWSITPLSTGTMFSFSLDLLYR